MCKYDVTHKTGCTQHVATPTEEVRATDIGNMRKKLVKIGHVVPEIYLRTDRQTHTETDRHGNHNASSPATGGEVINKASN